MMGRGAHDGNCGPAPALEVWATDTQTAPLTSGNSEPAPRPPRPAAEDKPSGQARRRSPRPWTDADDAELRRLFDQGRTQADARREMGRPSGVISEKWGKLIEEKLALAEQKLMPIEHVRQVSAMQNAGKSAAEIKAWLDQRQAPAQPDGNPATKADIT
jgi:hypothetical protein